MAQCSERLFPCARFAGITTSLTFFILTFACIDVRAKENPKKSKNDEKNVAA